MSIVIIDTIIAITIIVTLIIITTATSRKITTLAAATIPNINTHNYPPIKKLYIIHTTV